MDEAKLRSALRPPLVAFFRVVIGVYTTLIWQPLFAIGWLAGWLALPVWAGWKRAQEQIDEYGEDDAP